LYGGALVNPIYALTQLCASLHGANGRVNIPGFYEGVIPPAQWEREEIKKSPNNEAEIKKALEVDDFFHQEGMTPMEAISFYPTLEFNGMQGGYQGPGVKTVLPSKALVKMTMRLVSGQDPKHIAQLVKETIMKRCPKGVKMTITMRDEGAPAYVVIPPHRSNSPKDMKPILVKAFDAAEEAIERTFGKKPLYVRGGGSIPIMSQIKSVLNLDCIMIGLGLPEDAVHSPNESLDVRMMQKGIGMSKMILKKIAH
jgi:acetylornithine deacetylase/succinyl-diaminopimelate desuccinylase-like protein